MSKYPAPPETKLHADSTPRERMLHWVNVLKWSLDNPGAAPHEIEKRWWLLIVKHGSNEYDEVLYSVGADPTDLDTHPENDP